MVGSSLERSSTYPVRKIRVEPLVSPVGPGLNPLVENTSHPQKNPVASPVLTAYGRKV